MISLMLFFDMIDGTNPVCHLTMIDVIEPALVALSKTEWNAVWRCAERLVRRDYGLDRPTIPLPAIQQLLGHADIATTTIYTRVSDDDLARMMGTPEVP